MNEIASAYVTPLEHFKVLKSSLPQPGVVFSYSTVVFSFSAVISSTSIDSIGIPIVFWSFVSTRVFTIFAYVGVEFLKCRRTLGVGVE